MCSPEMCSSCGKFGWTGCGQHVKDLMAELPEEVRCDCGATVWPESA
uniref:Uncharacterized protein n=1 Tax=uncultured bacterium A1Q1_fos_2116 TaxID=1256564 RepID=L7VXJ3_9BACT|nr:hypothetical protein [uncultured bacterium A1Q1_fos_2116]